VIQKSTSYGRTCRRHLWHIIFDQELISYRYSSDSSSSCSFCVQGSVVSKRIGMKFGRSVFRVNTYRLTADFWLWRQNFEMAAMTLFYAEKYCRLVRAHRAFAYAAAPASSWSIVYSYLFYSYWQRYKLSIVYDYQPWYNGGVNNTYLPEPARLRSFSLLPEACVAAETALGVYQATLDDRTEFVRAYQSRLHKIGLLEYYDLSSNVSLPVNISQRNK